MKKLLALLALSVAALSFGASTASGYNLENRYHWWHGTTQIAPQVLDRTNLARNYNVMLFATANLANRSNKINFTDCLNATTSGSYNACTTPAECNTTDWWNGTCPGAGQGVITVFDADYGNAGWAGETSYWTSNDNIVKADILLNSYSGYVNRAANTGCHELGHAVGLDHRYDYPAVASCINDTGSGANSCKNLSACDYLSDDDVINGLDNDLYNHVDTAASKPPGMFYSSAMRALKKYGNDVPKKIQARFHMSHHIERTLAVNLIPTPFLSELVLSAQGNEG